MMILTPALINGIIIICTIIKTKRTRALLVGEIAAAHRVDSNDGPLEEDHGAEKVQPKMSTPLHPVSFAVPPATDYSHIDDSPVDASN